MPRFTSVLAPVALIAGLFIAAPGEVLAQDKVGVNSAVNPDASGTPPGGNTRKLVIGQDVVYNEHITTGPSGQTQLLFLDESSMTVGPNADLTIDQFVYDPKTGSGKLAMSATRGLLRYVGGKLSKQDEAVTLKTSTATLAVRGGAFIVNITSTSTNTVFVYGNGLTVTSNAGGTQTVSRPGFGTSVASGSSPSQPAPAPQGELTSYLQQLDGRPGGNGGATTIPSDTTVQNSGVSNNISGNVTNSVQQAQQSNQGQGTGSGNSGASTSNTVNNSTNNLGTTANSTASCGAAGTCPSGSNGTFTNSSTSNTSSNTSTSGNNSTGGNTGNNTPTPPSPVTLAGRLKNTNGNGTTRGFFDQTANADIPYANGTLSFPNGTTSPGVFNGTFNSNGATLGTLSFPLARGSATFTGTSSTLGPISGSSFFSADGTFFYANITPTNQPTERLFISGGTATGTAAFQPTGTARIFAFTVQPDAALQSNIPFVRGQAGGNQPNASVSPLYAVAPPNSPIGSASTTTAARGLQASLAVNGQQANQQSVISVTTGAFATSASGQPQFGGVMRGSSQLSATSPPTRLGSAVSSTMDANGNSFYGGTNNITGFTLDQTQYNQTTTPGTLGTAVTPSTASEVPLSGTGGTNYGFAQPAVASTVPAGVGTSRTTRAMTGNFGGLMYTTAQSTPYAVSGGAFIATDAATNRVQGTLAGSAQTPSSGVSTVQMQFGGLSGNEMGRAAFIDNNKFAALESATTPQQINGQGLTVNGNSTDAGKLYMVSSGAAGLPTQLLPSSSFCQCQFLQWGYWGGDLRTGNGADQTISRVDRGNINTWVVGTPTSTTDLSNLISIGAQATYTGAAVGSVFNNGASYMAASPFTGTYNFGTQTGSMSLINFDNKGTITASGRAPLSGPNYSLTVNNPAVTGSVNGTFYGPGAAETGGSFALQGASNLPPYIVSGTFAGKK